MSKVGGIDGVKMLHNWDFSTFAGYGAKNVSSSALSALMADPVVATVEQDAYVYATGAPAKACTSQTQNGEYYNLARASQEELNTRGPYEYDSDSTSDKDTIVYVADTGIRITHDEFKTGRAIWGTNTVDSRDEDCNGHGTHCAGTVAGVTSGIHKGATVVSAKCLDCFGSGSYDAVISSVNWCVTDKRTRSPDRTAVLSMSLGGPVSTALNAAIEAAVDEGMFVSVAAGNSANDACSSSPASAPGAYTIGSTDSSDDRSSFSSFGTCVDIFGPGSSIRSAYYTSDSAYQTLSGTSMATPWIAGIAAMEITANNAITEPQLKTKMTTSALAEKLDLKCASSPYRSICEATPNLLAHNPCE